MRKTTVSLEETTTKKYSGSKNANPKHNRVEVKSVYFKACLGKLAFFNVDGHSLNAR